MMPFSVTVFYNVKGHTGDFVFTILQFYILQFYSDALQATVTALYCKILVILGLAFPMAEVISDNVPKGYYQVSRAIGSFTNL
jgi:hypothetical protein